MEKAEYPCWGAGFGPMFPEFNRVVYAIVGDCCYFSGIEKKFRTSTINAADSVITAICKQEGILPDRLRWFDLQTHRGYDSKQPGEFELDELVILPNPDDARRGGAEETEIAGVTAVVITQDTHDIVVNYWISTLCPPDIFLLFREYIDT